MGNASDAVNVLIGVVATLGKKGKKLVKSLKEEGALDDSQAAHVLREAANDAGEGVRKLHSALKAGFNAVSSELSSAKDDLTSRKSKTTARKTTKKRKK